MRKTRLTLFYVAAYLIQGGLGFLFFPALTLKLFFATGAYSDLMVRFTGALLLGLAVFVVQIIRHRNADLYFTTLLVRVPILATLAALYLAHREPLMAVLFGIVGIGFAATSIAYVLDRRDPQPAGLGAWAWAVHDRSLPSCGRLWIRARRSAGQPTYGRVRSARKAATTGCARKVSTKATSCPGSRATTAASPISGLIPSSAMR